MGKGEVQKGFLVILLLILGAAVLVSYLNNDGTGYASSTLRGSSGIAAPDNNCECSSTDLLQTVTTNYICSETGLPGTRTCVYKCVKGLNSCIAVWQKLYSNRDGNVRTTVEKFLDGQLQLQSCTTSCRREE